MQMIEPHPRPTALLALAALSVSAVLSAASAQSNTTGTFTDKRDGKTYRTVVIGKQRWMAENLNFETGKSVCHDNEESYCQKYGRLYDWNDAMTACPAGWRLPSEKEWDSLALAVGGKRVAHDKGGYYWEGAGKKLKSKEGWYSNGNGTDDYGFSALPGGYFGIHRGSTGNFYEAGGRGDWWSATEIDGYANPVTAWSRYMNLDNDNVYRNNYKKTSLKSARCIEDVAAPQ